MLALIAWLATGVLLIGLASSVEVALFALPYSRTDELRASGRRGSQSLAWLRDHPASLLATVWSIRIAGFAIAVVGTWNAPLLKSLSSAWLILLLILVIGLAVLAEFAGKTLAQRVGEPFCLAVSPSTRLASYTLAPVTWPAERIVRLLSPKFDEIVPGISDREIRDLVNPGNGEAVIEEHERRLIQKAFLLDQTTAYDIMTPRVDIYAWPEERTLAEIAPELRAARYSRVPLFDGSIDKITGVLYTRDAYQALISGQRDVQLRALAREPFFVPGTVTLDKLLFDFQTRRIHLGVVIDEYGGVDGLIALEDILEELVGEIVDESDVAEEPIIRLGRNVVLVDGGADLREINHFFNTTFPLLEHRSLNGYLLDVLGRVPEPGEKLTQEGVLIEVTAATDTQVLRARLTRLAPRPGVDPEPAPSPGESRVE
jgi:CBS domain containing-hemolysin-like protein